MTNNAAWGVDYYNRTGTAMSNMFDNKPDETWYLYTENDSYGALLDGRHSYEITFPADQEPPVNGFWSMTLYNEHQFFHPNDLKRSTPLAPSPRVPRWSRTGCPRPLGNSPSTSAPTGARRRFWTARGSRRL
jgi:hypothetical protein